MTRIDEKQIYQWYDVFKQEGELVEIRLVGDSGTASGYFTDPNTLVNAIKGYTTRYNIYFIVNQIDPACYGRPQKDRILAHAKNATTDKEIIARDWILIDVDPKRPAGICSTKEETMKAHEVAEKICDFLIEQGFYPPILVFSSSGFHIYLRCALSISKENDTLVKRFLSALDMLFSNEKADVDLTVANSGNLSRLPGTYSCKGAPNDKDRPQRMCRFIRVPDEIKVNEKEYFEKVANLLPEVEKPKRENNYSSESFNLDEFIQKHGIEVSKIEDYSDGKKYILSHCLFDENHKGKDAVIFQRKNGALAYHCFHNSCSQYTWRDVRLKYEPDAYDKKEYREFQFRQRQYGKVSQPFVPVKETEEKGKKWLSMSDIKRVDISELLSIPTGYRELDKKIIGLFAGELTVISGLNASGKTSWLDCLALNVVNKGFKVGIWSGEMQDWRFQGWINQMAAGKNCVRKKEGYDNFYYTPSQYCEKIEQWLEGKMFLYNNSYGSRWEQLFSDVKSLVETEGVHLIILDNLAALNIDGYDGEKYSKQTKFIIDLKDYAKQKNIHIILVAHPRKENYFLRKESISGTADLTNIADNLILIHRVGKDFEKRASEFLGEEVVKPYLEYSNVLEVAKNRQLGIVDYLVGLYYEVESRRLKNDIAEHIIYGWEEQPQEQTFESLNTSASFTSDEFDNPFEEEEIEDLPF